MGDEANKEVHTGARERAADGGDDVGIADGHLLEGDGSHPHNRLINHVH
jgi:hypothetical protein